MALTCSWKALKISYLMRNMLTIQNGKRCIQMDHAWDIVIRASIESYTLGFKSRSKLCLKLYESNVIWVFGKFVDTGQELWSKNHISSHGAGMFYLGFIISRIIFLFFSTSKRMCYFIAKSWDFSFHKAYQIFAKKLKSQLLIQQSSIISHCHK